MRLYTSVAACSIKLNHWFSVKHCLLQAKDVMSKFLHRTAHPSSHRVEAGPLRVCVGGRETVGAHTSPPLLSATKHFGRAASSLSGRMGGDTALRWLLKKHTHLEGARASAAQSAANIAAVNQGLRCDLICHSVFVLDSHCLKCSLCVSPTFSLYRSCV